MDALNTHSGTLDDLPQSMPAWKAGAELPLKAVVRLSVMKTPIIQFGTSRFLQAQADLFISDAMRAGPGRSAR